MQDIPQKLEAEDVKEKLSFKTALNMKVEYVGAKLSCETSPKSEKLKIWNEALVGACPQKVKVEVAEAKLPCETSLKNGKLKT